MADSITPEQLAAWEALADACCPGRWHYDDGVTDDQASPPERGKPQHIEVVISDPRWAALADATVAPIAHLIPGAFPNRVVDAHGRFMAAARAAVPALIAEVRRLRERGFEVYLYDRDDYAGARAPESVMPREGPRYAVRAVRVSNGATLWAARATTRAEARALVPVGGVHFDRTGNWPSPMVPIEGWRFDTEPPAPTQPSEVGRG